MSPPKEAVKGAANAAVDPIETRARQLRDLIDQYQLNVSEAFSAFLDSGLCSAPESRVEWGANGIAHKGAIRSGGSYQKLAFGLHIERNGLTIAFDFGKNGEINEFDAFRLSQFWADNRMNRTGKNQSFKSERVLEDTFAEAVAVGAFSQTASKRYTLFTG